MKLIDSNSNKFIIKSAKKIKTIGLLWSFNLFKGQQLEVDLFFDEKVEPVELVIFKELLTKHLREDKYFWNSDGDFHKRLKFISNANSTKEILEFFTNEFHKKY